MYCVDGVMGLLGQRPSAKRSYIYARVSSDKQRGDLERQINDLKEAYPDHQIIKDIASGVNFKRKGMQTLLERVLAGMVSEVVVMHRDRLARIGCDLLEFIFATFGTKLVVHSKDDDPDFNHDLADDLLAVTTHFVASYNGRRAAENCKRRRKAGDGEAKKRGREAATDGGGGRKEEEEEEEL